MSKNTPNVSLSLREAALERAAKQFPEFDPEYVVASNEKRNAELMAQRPTVKEPMRDLRSHDLG